MGGTVVLSALEQAALNDTPDEDLVRRVLTGETQLFELIIRRHSQRLYRVARGILRDGCEAEDVMQAAYVRAYQHLAQFAGRAKFSTWLTRIAVHEALARVQRRARYESLDARDRNGVNMELASSNPDPEQQTATTETNALLASAILSLPETYRTVLMLRDIDNLSTAETAECLDLTEENVKVRLHRARALLRRELYARAGHRRESAF